jgi:predicted nuclease of restriction endonuclease-like (RecB) superfamily
MQASVRVAAMSTKIERGRRASAKPHRDGMQRRAMSKPARERSAAARGKKVSVLRVAPLHRLDQPDRAAARGKKVSALRRQLAVKKPSAAVAALANDADIAALALDLGKMIEAARQQVAVAANAVLTTLYWEIGRRILTEILDGNRAEYGAQIVAALGRDLEARHGRGFDEKSLRHMVRFAETFPDAEIVSALRRQLSWSHFKQLAYLDDPLKREFYAEMCRIEGWSTRVLAQKIDGMLYERTALSKKPERLIRQELAALRDKGDLTPALVLQDPYVLDFLKLADTYSEDDLEAAILREIERFLLELGVGFAFLERQKRIVLDGEDYYIDLLFFHRRMRRLVAIELKIGDFKPAYSGQMELYLRWLDRHERQPSEGAPLGIILCAGKKRETVEYLNLDARGIHVAEYLTELPSREMLRGRLHRAIEAARRRLVPDVTAGGEPDRATPRSVTKHRHPRARAGSRRRSTTPRRLPAPASGRSRR